MEPYQLIKIRNRFPDNSLKDVKKACRQELVKLKGLIGKDTSVAVGVGSRGIDQLVEVVKEVVEFIKGQGAFPFIVPAMGSHGGGTAKGQEEVLTGYGITENNVGAPVRCSAETVQISGPKNGQPVFMDKLTWESDGVILINKIKPHPDFHGRYESGLVKMAVIGLGKEPGAKLIHSYGIQGLVNLIPVSAKKIFDSGKILAGVAIVENACDRIMKIQAIPGRKIMDAEPGLLDIARSNHPRLPVARLDVLIIDRMGKNISGVGMDTSVIGRIRIYGQPEPEGPDIKSVVVTDLTDESHGNATGVGLADIITRKLYNKIDFDITYKNISTNGFLERGKIPFIAENDLEAVQLALRNCGNVPPGQERIIRIKDTLHLDELYVSEAIRRELTDNPLIETEGKTGNIFDSRKMLFPF